MLLLITIRVRNALYLRVLLLIMNKSKSQVRRTTSYWVSSTVCSCSRVDAKGEEDEFVVDVCEAAHMKEVVKTLCTFKSFGSKTYVHANSRFD